jgi:hypothetical protein
MREIPEALRLAYALKERHGANSFEDDAATELRRQHAEIERMKAERDEAVKAEREACAAIAEMPKYLNETGILTVNPAKSAAAHFIAIAIRARGEVPR